MLVLHQRQRSRGMAERPATASLCSVLCESAKLEQVEGLVLSDDLGKQDISGLCEREELSDVIYERFCSQISSTEPCLLIAEQTSHDSFLCSIHQLMLSSYMPFHQLQ